MAKDHKMRQPLGVILAGGLATRMGGGDKAMLRVQGRTLLAHILNRLEPQVKATALNANGDPARFSYYGLTVIPDSIDGYPGPLAGVLAGLDWAAEQGADSIVTVAADTPFFPRDLVCRLLLSCEGRWPPLALAATPRTDGKILKSRRSRVIRHPTFGLWPVTLRNDLRDAVNGGLRKMVSWADRHDAGEALFAAEPFDPFFNVNTPEDLAHAENLAQEGRI